MMIGSSEFYGVIARRTCSCWRILLNGKLHGSGWRFSRQGRDRDQSDVEVTSADNPRTIENNTERSPRGTTSTPRLDSSSFRKARQAQEHDNRDRPSSRAICPQLAFLIRDARPFEVEASGSARQGLHFSMASPVERPGAGRPEIVIAG